MTDEQIYYSFRPVTRNFRGVRKSDLADLQGALRGSEATERGEGLGNFAFGAPQKTVSDAYFGQRLLEHDFLQIAMGKTVTI